MHRIQTQLESRADIPAGVHPSGIDKIVRHARSRVDQQNILPRIGQGRSPHQSQAVGSHFAVKFSNIRNTQRQTEGQL